ncbi:hypothetical protein LO763_13565 [Glycomyces sp. A-F 0318]|uniref:sigma factor n=1 Tax=Glycomyces amatae TaxID=2881355 RepID=UPI001E42382E|nr:sigma factor [Glycomyces amatae]MCD0444651.1 hypothetical protein [Glycomyces amatae]
MTDPTPPSGGPDEYGHLAPLFAEMSGLDVDEPRRSEIRDRLIVGYLPLVGHLARRYAVTGFADEDLLRIASVGLIHAIDRFDPAQGADFLSFAIPTISAEVRRRFRDTTWPARTRRPLRTPRPALGQVRAALARRLGRLPTDEELADHFGAGSDAAAGDGPAQRAVALDEPGPGAP